MPRELIENTDWGKVGMGTYLFSQLLNIINKDVVTWAVGILGGIFGICYYAVKMYSEFLTIKEKKKSKNNGN